MNHDELVVNERQRKEKEAKGKGKEGRKNGERGMNEELFDYEEEDTKRWVEINEI